MSEPHAITREQALAMYDVGLSEMRAAIRRTLQAEGADETSIRTALEKFEPQAMAARTKYKTKLLAMGVPGGARRPGHTSS